MAQYAKYSNFGMQKFRIDFSGQRNLRLTESSVFEFNMPRYGDLLMDTYMVVNLPTIWSPAMPPQVEGGTTILSSWQPYEFKWIDNIGTQMIERVRFTVGGAIIQEFSGQYLNCLSERDLTGDKKQLYREVINAKNGDKVIVSGKFLILNNNLVDLNYSNYGSLNDPKFLFDFTSISKINKLKP